jgi:mRNA-degrading endonuclease toxin of MazEF toxin-antitoxin module
MQNSRRYPRAGEIWFTDFGDPFPHEPAGRRPAVIIGPRTSRSSSLPFVFAVPITTTLRKSVCHIEIAPNADNGLKIVSAAQTELMRSISRERCIEQMGIIDSDSWNAIRESVQALLNY